MVTAKKDKICRVGIGFARSPNSLSQTRYLPQFAISFAFDIIYFQDVRRLTKIFMSEAYIHV